MQLKILFSVVLLTISASVFAHTSPPAPELKAPKERVPSPQTGNRPSPAEGNPAFDSGTCYADNHCSRDPVEVPFRTMCSVLDGSFRKNWPGSPCEGL